MTMTTIPTIGTPTDKKEEDQIVQIPIEKIEVDREWNSRKYLGDDSDGGPEEHSFSDLVDSIRQNGQRTPIEVRKVEGSDDHYTMISGFRRITAISKVYAKDETVPGLEKGCVRAIVKHGISEMEALILNGSENTARQNLNMADTAYLVHRLSTKYRMKERDIATKLALSQPYVNQLQTVYRGTCNLRIEKKDGSSQTIFDFWRDAPGRVTFTNMLEFARLKIDDRVKEIKFLELLKPDTGKQATKKKSFKRDDAQAAEQFGVMLGRMVASKVLDFTPVNWRRTLAVGRKMSFEGMTEEYIEMVCQSAQRGYERGLHAANQS